MAKSKTLKELTQHYQMWTQDNEKRMTRDNGWNDITDAYYGKLPEDWPYITRLVDPRIRTSLIEKNARLINSKLRGRLVPREGADSLSAALNNALLDFQWDNANDGGSMLTKISICDMDTRMYQSKFALVYWKYEKDDKGNVIFDGNEFLPLDIRDCGMDSSASCTHIKNAKWFQYRSYEYVEDLENQLDAKGKPIYQNLGELKVRLAEKLGQKQSTNRTTDYVPRIKTLRGLEDRTGEDMAFPMVKIVTEYRRDRWITFAPDYGLILRDIPNPYQHGRIPIAQLRYYPLQDDPLGESEVEPVLDLWLAIQATICAYMDEVILKMRPPLKIIENAARIETIQRGPDAQWLVDRQDAVEEMTSNMQSLQFFQTTYQALVSAFNVAMGDLSAQNVSNIDPFSSGNKTATEVKATMRQQNVRDKKNQNDLAEFIEDIMMMWLSNNRQFLFSDPKKTDYIIKIVGQDQFNLFKRAGLDQMEAMPEAMQMIGDTIAQNPTMSDAEIEQLYQTASLPKYPVVLNPKEKDPTKLQVKPKMSLNEMGDTAEVSLVPKDLQGTFDYIPDVKSMAVGAGDELIQARQRAMGLITSNPLVLQLLQLEGWYPKVKELLSADLEDSGLKDAERFFGKTNTAQSPTGQMGGSLPPSPNQGLSGIPQAGPPGGLPQPMAGSLPSQGLPGVS